LFDTLRPSGYTRSIITPETEMTNQSRISTAIQVGDTVAYTATFIERHGPHLKDAQAAQGQVTALHNLESGGTLADIDWNKPGLPKRVNVKKLLKPLTP
jgi:hypothetical protein